MNLTPSERQTLADARRIRAAKAKALREAVKRVRVIEKADRGRVREPGYLAYLRRQPCRIGTGCEGRVEAAHVRYGDHKAGRVNPGLQKKPDDRWCVSLCTHHHAEQHRSNERAWWNSYGLDGSQVAAAQYAEFSGEISLTARARREQEIEG